MYYLACCPPGTLVPTVNPDELAIIAEQYRQRMSQITGRLIPPPPPSSSSTIRRSSSSSLLPLSLTTLQRRFASSQKHQPAPPAPYSATGLLTAEDRKQRPASSTALQRQKMYAAPSIPLRRGMFGDEEPSSALLAAGGVGGDPDSGGGGGGGGYGGSWAGGGPSSRGPSSRTLLRRAMKSGMAALQAGIAPKHAANSVAHETGHGGGGGASGSGAGGGPKSMMPLCRGFTCGLCLQKFGTAAACGAGSSLSGGGGADGDGTIGGDGGSSSGGGSGGGGGVGAGGAGTSGVVDAVAGAGAGGGKSSNSSSSLLASRRKQRELEQQHGDNIGNLPAKPAALVSVRAIVEIRSGFLREKQEQLLSKAGADGNNNNSNSNVVSLVGGGAADAKMLSASGSPMKQSNINININNGRKGNDLLSFNTDEDDDENGDLFRSIGAAAGGGRRAAVYSGRANCTASEDLHAAQSAMQHGYETVALCRFCAQFFGVYLGKTFGSEEEQEAAALAKRVRAEQRKRSVSRRARRQRELEQQQQHQQKRDEKRVAAAYAGAGQQQQQQRQQQPSNAGKKTRGAAASNPLHDSLASAEAISSSPFAAFTRASSAPTGNGDEDANGHDDDDDDGRAAPETARSLSMLVPRRPSTASRLTGAPPHGPSGRRPTLPFAATLTGAPGTATAATVGAETNRTDEHLLPSTSPSNSNAKSRQQRNEPRQHHHDDDDHCDVVVSPVSSSRTNNNNNSNINKQRAVSPSGPPVMDDLAYAFDYHGPSCSARRHASYLASLRRRAEQHHLTGDVSTDFFSPKLTLRASMPQNRELRRQQRFSRQQQQQQQQQRQQQQQQPGDRDGSTQRKTAQRLSQQQKQQLVQQQLVEAGADAHDIVVPMSGRAFQRLSSRESLAKAYPAERKRSKMVAIESMKNKLQAGSTSSSSKSSDGSPTRSGKQSPLLLPLLPTSKMMKLLMRDDEEALAGHSEGEKLFVLDDKEYVDKDAMARRKQQEEEEAKLEEQNEGAATSGMQLASGNKRTFGSDLTNQQQHQQQQQQQQQQQKRQQLPATHTVASATIVTASLSSSCVAPTCVSALLPRVVDASIEETTRVARLELATFVTPATRTSSDIEIALVSAWSEKACVAGAASNSSNSSSASPAAQGESDDREKRKTHLVFLIASCRTAAALHCCRGGNNAAPSCRSSSSNFGLVVDGMPSDFCLCCALVRMSIAAAAASADLVVVLDCTVPSKTIRSMWRDSLLSCENVILVAPGGEDDTSNSTDSGSSSGIVLGRLTASLLIQQTGREEFDSVRISPIRGIQQHLSLFASSAETTTTTTTASAADATRTVSVLFGCHPSSLSSSSSSRRSKSSRYKKSHHVVVFYELEANASFLRRPSRAMQLPGISSCLLMSSINEASMSPAGKGAATAKTKILGVALLLDSAVSSRNVTFAHAERMQRAVLQHFDGAEDQWAATVCATVSGHIFVFLMPKGFSAAASAGTAAHQRTSYPLPPPGSSSLSSAAVASSASLPPRPSSASGAAAAAAPALSTVPDSERVVLVAAHVLSRRKTQGTLKALAGIKVDDVAIILSAASAAAAAAGITMPSQQGGGAVSASSSSVVDAMLQRLAAPASAITITDSSTMLNIKKTIVDFLP